MPERHAIYYAPGVTDPLWTKAAEWLGRDPLGAAKIDGPVAGLARDMLHARSVSARRYGFHATLKAPIALADGQSRAELEAALAAFAARTPSVEIGPLQLALLDGFLALIPVRQSAELTGFASEVVVNFDRFRAPPSDAERARRHERQPAVAAPGRADRELRLPLCVRGVPLPHDADRPAGGSRPGAADGSRGGAFRRAGGPRR